MKTFAIAVTLTVCALLSLLPTLHAEEVLNNAGVIELKNAGLGDAVIAYKIKASKCDFDISTDALKKLKEAELSDELISVIIEHATPAPAPAKPKPPIPAISNDPNVSHEPGLWLYQELQGNDHRMVKLRAQSSGRSSGWNKKSRAVLYGASSVLQLTTTTPTFYFYDTTRPDAAYANAGTAAEDLVLAKLEVRNDKNDRRLAVGRDEFFGGHKSGLDAKGYVAVNVEKVADGIYRIVPAQELQPGEYCFVDRNTANRETLKHGDIQLYDFGVKR